MLNVSKTKLFIILSFSILVASPAFAKAKKCCGWWHNGISTCTKGKIVCGDGSVSKCNCFNNVLKKVDKTKYGTKPTLKNRVKNIFKRKSN